MFFVLSKILGFLAVPSNFVAIAALAGAGLLLTRWRKPAVALMIASIVTFALLGWSPLSHMLLLSLSERFPAWQAGRADPHGIIVLGGTIDPEVSDARNAIELDSSAERAMALVTLARRFPNARIIFSGGSGRLSVDALSEAPFAKKLLAEFDLTGDRFLFEGGSRTTYENATSSFGMLAPTPEHRFLLVTSSFHMPRAMGAFRRAGFEVEAYPVDWRTRGWRDASQPFDRLSSGLARADVAIHEWIGLIVYWMTDRSTALFPAPWTANCDNAAPNDKCRPRPR
jgi:uncharacterized SAM-binding protein YcdF (DUF218 family)